MRVRAIALSVGALALVLVAVLATRPSAETKEAQSPLLGHPAPALQGTALDGSTVRLSDYRGRWVVLNFFATWCVPCQREHPQLIAFTRRHAAAHDAQVLGVIFDDTVARARSFVARNGGSWPLVDDPGGSIALDFGVRGPPESYLVDPNGDVLAKVVGEVTDAGLERLLQRAQARENRAR